MQTFFAFFPALDANQMIIIGVSFILLYFLFFVMRDIFLRTNSTVYQILSILLVAALPVVGFLLYFLIRPARTLKQRELEELLLAIVPKRKASEIERRSTFAL